MQSGRGKTGNWILEFEPLSRAEPDPLMGWAGSADTRKQLCLHFDSLEDAVAWARKNNHAYVVEQPKDRRIRPKAYAENFAYTRMQPWTH